MNQALIFFSIFFFFYKENDDQNVSKSGIVFLCWVM